MSVIQHLDRDIPSEGLSEVERAVAAVAATVDAVLAGEITGPTAFARPLPVAFLDDGRRVVLVIDRDPEFRLDRERPLDQPRSWGVEVASDGDLVGRTPKQLAFRSTQRLTADQAARAAQFLLDASA